MKIIGSIQENEARSLQLLTERKNSLCELQMILISESDKPLFLQVTEDIKDVESKIEMWWQDIKNRYCLTFERDCNYEVNFFTYEITEIRESIQ